MGQYKRISIEPSGIPMRDWVASVPNNGIIRYLGLFNQERLLITSSKALSEVLVTRNYEFEKPPHVRYVIGRVLGVGVLLAEGDQHRIQRRNLMPAFAFRHIKDLYPAFWRKAREGIQAMTAEVLKTANQQDSSNDVEKVATSSRGKTSSVLEVGGWASRITLDIIGVAGLGRDFGAIQNPDNHLYETYRNLFQPSAQARALSVLSLMFPSWLLRCLPIKRNSQLADAAKTIKGVCRDLIQVKKEKLSRKEPTDVDILSTALESGGFSDEELVDQLMTFLAAGHETTASAMTWAVYLLSKYPEIQGRLRRETRENLPSINNNQDVSSNDIDRLPYLNAVCNEVLRFFNPVPLTVRDAVVDTTIQGQPIPKGTRIMIVPWATNYDEKLWGPDAHEFKPERWVAKGEDDKRAASGGASSNYAFLSFLHGPRSCIGQSFAKAEFACLLASWIGRFEFELKNKNEMDENNLVIKGGVTARPANGLYVQATVVDGW